MDEPIGRALPHYPGSGNFRQDTAATRSRDLSLLDIVLLPLYVSRDSYSDKVRHLTKLGVSSDSF